MDVVDGWYSLLIVEALAGIGDSVAASPASTWPTVPYLAAQN